jgi:secreted trypsin-like serine protease
MTKLKIFSFVFFNCVISVLSNNCGKSFYSSGLVVNGDQVKRGEWPFAAALFYTQGDKFFCGEPLITAKHVVSAAHCFQEKFGTNLLSPSELVVMLGKHNLNSTYERGSVPSYVREIFIHPDWKVNSDDYDADISLLLMEKPVELSEYIFPVCWPFTSEPFQQGTIVS